MFLADRFRWQPSEILNLSYKMRVDIIERWSAAEEETKNKGK